VSPEARARAAKAAALIETIDGLAELNGVAAGPRERSALAATLAAAPAGQWLALAAAARVMPPSETTRAQIVAHYREITDGQ